MLFLTVPSKKKTVVQPTRIICTSRISWNRTSDWLPIIFHFGTEILEEQLEKAPCMYIYIDNVDDIDNVGHSYLSQKMKLLNFDDLNKLQLGDSHVSTFKPKLQGNR